VGSMTGRDIVAISDFNRAELDLILETALRCELGASKRHFSHLLQGSILAAVFLEPSTRTRLSFESAMQRLGGGVISVAEALSSSLVKGESLSDMIRVIEQYADVITLRSPEKGAALVAADVASIPIINGGDGTHEHPTQALLDLYTIKKERGRLDGLTVAMVGDLKNGRTVHSLIQALLPYKPTILPVAPEELALPEEWVRRASEANVHVEHPASFDDALAHADVIYMTRVQRERLSSGVDYATLQYSYRLDRAAIERTRCTASIMHPLPRLTELAEDVDVLPTAAYIRQAGNGIWVRQALLGLVLGGF